MTPAHPESATAEQQREVWRVELVEDHSID